MNAKKRSYVLRFQKHKKARNLARQVEEAVRESKIKFLCNILYVKFVYLNCREKNTKIN